MRTAIRGCPNLRFEFAGESIDHGGFEPFVGTGRDRWNDRTGLAGGHPSAGRPRGGGRLAPIDHSDAGRRRPGHADERGHGQRPFR